MTLNIGFRHATPPPKEREREKDENTPFPSRHADPVWCALAMAHECRKPSGLQYVHVKKPSLASSCIIRIVVRTAVSRLWNGGEAVI